MDAGLLVSSWIHRSKLLASHTEAKAGAEVRSQPRVSNHIVVMIVERIAYVRIGRYVPIYGVPGTEIDALISCGVIHWRNRSEEKVGVGAAADKGPADTAAKTGGGIRQQQVAGMARTMKKRVARRGAT